MAVRRLSTSTLIVLLMAIFAIIPGLYLMQWVYNSSRQREAVLVADLQVYLNSSDPHHLAIPLLQDPSKPGISLHGSGMLKSGSFPWPEAPFEAQLVIDFTTTLGDDPETLRSDEHFVAWYRERYLGEGGVTQKVPCEGWVKLRKHSLHQGIITNIEAELELACTGFGRDMRWHTPDDVTWLIQGEISRRWQAPEL